MTTYYKFLDKDGKPYHGGNGQWSLPTRNDDGTWAPGEWMPPVEGEIMPCENGYHLCETRDLINWFAPALYVAEGRGDNVRDGNKTVFREARLLRPIETLNGRMSRLFACDCAEHVLHLFEARHPEDNRPQDCIAIARRYANGDATKDELAAAGDAAWAAARAARAAAGDARAAEQEWQIAWLLKLLKIGETT